MIVKTFSRQSAHQVIHHNSSRDSGVQRFRTAAHGQAEPMGRDGFNRIRDSIAFVSYDQHKARRNVLPIIERITIQL